MCYLLLVVIIRTVNIVSFMPLIHGSCLINIMKQVKYLIIVSYTFLSMYITIYCKNLTRDIINNNKLKL